MLNIMRVQQAPQAEAVSAANAAEEGDGKAAEEADGKESGGAKADKPSDDTVHAMTFPWLTVHVCQQVCCAVLHVL